MTKLKTRTNGERTRNNRNNNSRFQTSAGSATKNETGTNVMHHAAAEHGEDAAEAEATVTARVAVHLGLEVDENLARFMHKEGERPFLYSAAVCMRKVC